MVMTSDDPPKEMNGSGIPVTGSRPMTAPTLMNVSAAIQATRPTPSRAAEAVGGVRRPPAGRTSTSATSRPSTATAPDEPELLADDREDEVGVGVRQGAPL